MDRKTIGDRVAGTLFGVFFGGVYGGLLAVLIAWSGSADWNPAPRVKRP